MLSGAVSVLAVVAALGLYMAARVLRGRFAPWAVSLLHAGLGATGLVLLLAVGIVQAPGSRQLLLSFLLFLITALGGFFLASFHLRRRIAPRVIVAIHAAIGLGAFVTLVDGCALVQG